MSTLTEVSDNSSGTGTLRLDVDGNPISVIGATIEEHCPMNSLQACDDALFPLKAANLQLYRTLTGAGWGTSYHAAVGTFSFVFGMPDQHPEIDPHTGLTVYPNASTPRWLYESQFGTGIRAYNSHTTANPNPGAVWPSGTEADAGTERNVQYISLGETAAQTADILAAALGGYWYINGSGWYVFVFPIGDYRHTVANERVVETQGSIGVGGNGAGAGWVFTSQALNGVSVQLNISVYTGGFISGAAYITSLISDNGRVGRRDSISFQMASFDSWTFIADPYSFYARVEDGATEPAGDFNTGNQCYYVTVPNTAHMLSPHQSGVTLPSVSFTIQRDSFESLYYGGNDGNDFFFNTRQGTSWYFINQVNGAPSGSVRLSSGLSLGLPIRQGGTPLALPDSDYDVILPAQVFMSIDGPDATGPMYYAGDMWNCVLVQRDVGPILSRYVPDTSDGTSSGDAVDATEWVVVFKQDSAVSGSILMGIGARNLTDASGNPINTTTPSGVTIVHDVDGSLSILGATGTSAFIASGGTMSGVHGYTWAVSGLPLDWVSNGGVAGSTTATLTISGPTSGHFGKTFPISIAATDSLGASYTLQYLLVLGPQIIATATAATIPNAHVGIAYSEQPVAMQGGSGAFTPYMLEGGTLPPGLVFDTATGIVSGMPTTPGTYGGLIFSAQDSFTGVWSNTVTIILTVL